MIDRLRAGDPAPDHTVAWFGPQYWQRHDSANPPGVTLFAVLVAAYELKKADADDGSNAAVWLVLGVISLLLAPIWWAAWPKYERYLRWIPGPDGRMLNAAFFVVAGLLAIAASLQLWLQ